VRPSTTIRLLRGYRPSVCLPSWRDLKARERFAVRELDAPGCFPQEPGIYVWFRDGEPCYLGVATTSLRSRLGTHLRPTPGSVRGTTLKRSVAQLLGIASRTEARERTLNQIEVDRIVAWLNECELVWWVMPDPGAAKAAESGLLRGFRPTLNISA
jgi:hypothetical protein